MRASEALLAPTRARWAKAAVVVAAAFACACGPAQSDPTGLATADLVYGDDDRAEYFQVESDAMRARMTESMVALIPNSSLQRVGDQLNLHAATWGELDGLCPGERFADQPAAAFCSGVLVDWDLVLTAGHCVRAFALGDFVVAFDFFYQAPEQLELGSDLRTPIEIVAEALDPPASEPRLDFAWLRLDRPVEAGRAPVPLRLGPTSIALGEPIVTVSAGGGVPMKLDAGGQVRDLRAGSADYFVADSDTSKGSSGGAAFDRSLTLVGVLVRGAQDLSAAEGDTCRTTLKVPAQAAEEQFTYVQRAVAALCAADPTASSLCRADCGDPCVALSPHSSSPPREPNCTFRPLVCGSRGWPALGLLVALAAASRRRASRGLHG
jgi:hypothetical protein